MKYLRLKKKKDFQKVLKRGKRAHGSTLTVVYSPAAKPYAAVCVGKKFGKSVERNRIKRLLREAFRSLSDELRPCVLLLIPKLAEGYSYEGFRRDLVSVFGRERLFVD